MLSTRYERIAKLPWAFIFFALFLAAALVLIGVLWVMPAASGTEAVRDARSELPRLAVLAIAALLVLLSLFRPARRPAEFRFGLTGSVALLLTLCFAFGHLLSRSGDNETAVVYVLGFAALIIAGQHLVEFDEAKQTIVGVNRELKTTADVLQRELRSTEAKIGVRVDESRGDRYRAEVTSAYARARRRVLASASHWPIDPRFWSVWNDANAVRDEEFWAKQPVYGNLRGAIDTARGDPSSGGIRIVFTGRLDIIPQWTGDLAPEDRGPGLSIEDFHRFVGLLWRLALAHRLRTAMWKDAASASQAYRTNSDVRVVVTDIPFSAHVVDDSLHLLLSEPDVPNGKPSVGYTLVHENDPLPTRQRITETFAQLIESYTHRHVRSARECAAAFFVLAAAQRRENVDLWLEDRAHPEECRTAIHRLLKQLGLDRFAEVHAGLTEAEALGRDGITRRVVDLACDFFEHYYAKGRIADLPSRRDLWSRDQVAGRMTVDRLIEDLY